MGEALERVTAVEGASSPAGRGYASHAANCSVCRHESVDEIEALYVGWAPPAAITEAFQLRRGALRRHVAAMGLDAGRRGNASAVLGDLLERALGSLDSERKFSLDEVLMLVDKLTATERKANPSLEVVESEAGEQAGGLWDTQVRAFAMRQTRAIAPAARP